VKPHLFGCDLTLNCFRCGEELEIADPLSGDMAMGAFISEAMDKLGVTLLEAINNAYCEHRKKGECKERLC